MKRYTMTIDELEALKKAAATPGVFTGGILKGYNPAKAALEKLWQEMGERYGFDWETIQPVSGEPMEVFEAKEHELKATRER